MRHATKREEEFRITANSPAERLIEWSLKRFAHRRMVLTTGFGMEGCALIDMYATQGASLDVVYLDTGFFFAETQLLIELLRERYPRLRFRNRGVSLTPARQARLYGDRLWDRDPDRCCQLRKVAPMAAALAGADLWVTALRRSQGPARTGLEVLDWNWKYAVLQLSPLARWSRARVWDYIRDHGALYNPLHDRGYPSIGCTHCTKPVPGSAPGRYSRAGRWAGSEKSECGLHT